MYKVKRVVTRFKKVALFSRSEELFKMEQTICQFKREEAFDTISENLELNDISIKKLSEVMENVDCGLDSINCVTLKSEAYVLKYEKSDDEIYVRYILEGPKIKVTVEEEDNWI